MIYLTLFIPLIFALAFFVIKRKINIQYVWLLVVLPLPFTFRACSIHDQVKQNEILGGNVLAANYYEHWNEYLRVEESEGAFYWNLATIIFLSISWFITAMITFDHFNGASSNRHGRGYGRRW